MLACIAVHTTQTAVRTCNTLSMVGIEVASNCTGLGVIIADVLALLNTLAINFGEAGNALTEVFIPS